MILIGGSFGGVLSIFQSCVQRGAIGLQRSILIISCLRCGLRIRFYLIIVSLQCFILLAGLLDGGLGFLQLAAELRVLGAKRIILFAGLLDGGLGLLQLGAELRVLGTKRIILFDGLLDGGLGLLQLGAELRVLGTKRIILFAGLLDGGLGFFQLRIQRRFFCLQTGDLFIGGVQLCLQRVIQRCQGIQPALKSRNSFLLGIIGRKQGFRRYINQLIERIALIQIVEIYGCSIRQFPISERTRPRLPAA